eukprot:TRINITY_DN2675_c1_g1_i1.p1 TRINITY_DN2675_c1_g1~~TRINITY_DN2675_c1_g1_i1.p1  ORF type:complete len:567 (+),score=200.06 TRINITY_DN2675_c1_g1_i1:72-1703(+)
MGTSGLRKKVTEAQQENYVANFMQAILSSVPADVARGALALGGDGRYFNREALQIIVRVMAGNGVRRVLVARDGMYSTPAASAIIRKRKCTGGILLTASHNPGGVHGDFGIKFNTSNGGPATTETTHKIEAAALEVKTINMVDLPTVDLSVVGEQHFGDFTVEVIDPVTDYLEMLHTSFDFAAIREFLAKSGFKVIIDSLHAVTGAYTKRIFCDELGLPASSLAHNVPKEDFGGGHPDPNLTYAKALVDLMYTGEYDFGAAYDGDGDRNLVLGKKFFVTPSDSLAVLAANWEKIPYFKRCGFRGVARSMPTSAATDKVVEAFKVAGKPVNFFETPTGWKFFGNQMDAGKLSLCGEESFGTGCDLIREKDGIWASLAWLSVLAAANAGAEKLIGVADIVKEHWRKYGRNYYSRYDYENVDSEPANKVMAHLAELQQSGALKDALFNGHKLVLADDFAYGDPVDKSHTTHQGVRFVFADGSRIIFRLSGTGTVGATIRVYLDKFEAAPDKLDQDVPTALHQMIAMALEWSKITEFTGRKEPTVIT